MGSEALKAVPVGSPPAEDEGVARECPVCLNEVCSAGPTGLWHPLWQAPNKICTTLCTACAQVRANADWRVFPCGHMTCGECFARLLRERCACCPMCRLPLLERAAVAPGAARHVGLAQETELPRPCIVCSRAHFVL